MTISVTVKSEDGTLTTYKHRNATEYNFGSGDYNNLYIYGKETDPYSAARLVKVYNGLHWVGMEIETV